MLADFYIQSIRNDMKLVVQTDHLGRENLYRSPNPVKKTASLKSIWSVMAFGRDTASVGKHFTLF